MDEIISDNEDNDEGSEGTPLTFFYIFKTCNRYCLKYMDIKFIFSHRLWYHGIYFKKRQKYCKYAGVLLLQVPDTVE